MSKSKEVAAEWKRIDQAKDDIRSALVDRGVVIPKDAKIDTFADAIRRYPPIGIRIHKRGMFDGSPQSRLPNMAVSPAYSAADISGMFSNCASLSEIPHVDGLEVATSIAYYAASSRQVRGSVAMPSLPKCMSMESAFEYCGKIESINIDGADACINASNFANGCFSATFIKVGDLPNVVHLGQAFIGCRSATRIEISTGASLVSVGGMFAGCMELREIVGTLDLTSVEGTGVIFDSCNSLEEVRIKGLKTDITFRWSPSLSIESVKYLVDNLQQVTGKVIEIPISWQRAHSEEAREYAKIAAQKGFSLSFR